MSQLLRKLSLQQRLQGIIMLTVVVALVLVCSAFLTAGFLGARNSMRSDVEVLAKMIAANSSAALSFEDPNAARELLESLRTQPGIVAAYLHTGDGQIFARYWRGDTLESLLPKLIRCRSAAPYSKNILEFLIASRRRPDYC